MDAETTAQQWARILASMHALAAMGPSPLSAASIARHAKMEEAAVERHLRLMARVGLVHRARRGPRPGWLLERES